MHKLKVIILVFLVILFASSPSSAHSGADMDMLALSLAEQVKTLNKRNVWQLYSSISKTGVDLFYDSKNIQSPYSGFKIVTTKMKYNDKNFLSKLKKGRKLHHQVMGADSEKLNYKDIDYTIQTFEVDCSQKEIRKEEVIADFDKNNNLLNLLPAVRRQFSPIRENTSYEKLYNIVCKGN